LPVSGGASGFIMVGPKELFRRFGGRNSRQGRFLAAFGASERFPHIPQPFTLLRTSNICKQLSSFVLELRLSVCLPTPPPSLPRLPIERATPTTPQPSPWTVSSKTPGESDIRSSNECKTKIPSETCVSTISSHLSEFFDISQLILELSLNRS